MVYEIEIHGTAYVSVEFGGEDSARRIARDHIATGTFLEIHEGCAMGAGRYLVKGLSAVVGDIGPFHENGRFQVKKPKPEAVVASNEDIDLW